MKPPEEIQRELVLQWISKADEDFAAARHLLNEQGRFRGVIAFHCQQTVEKYLKAFMVRHQMNFPKTHDIGSLLTGVAAIDLPLATTLQDADMLTPFGVEVRYPATLPNSFLAKRRRQ
jgi:HEPN domain-containing protein